MPLAADISARLDASTLVNGFVGQLGGHGDALGAIAPPSGDTTSIGATLDGFDAGSLAPVIANLARQGALALQGVAGAGAAGNPLAAITGPLELVERVSAGNLRTDIEALFAQLSAELEGSTDGGVFGTLLQLSRLLAASPQGGGLGALVQSLLSNAGVTLPGAVSQAGDWLPALDSLVRAVGGLMMLESVLEESQRLTGLMAQQLDAAAVARQVDQLMALLDPALGARITAVDVNDDAALGALQAGLTVAIGRIAVLREAIAAGMGLGEATLAYLDVQQVQTEVGAAAALLRSIDLAPIQRLLQAALGGLQPLMGLDFTRAPAQSLSGLLDLAEAQMAGIASQVAAFDPGLLTRPLQQGIDTLSAPLADLTNIFAQVQAQIEAALQAVRRVVTELPVGDLAQAITTLVAPVAQVLAAIAALVADVAAALEAAATQAVAALGTVEGSVDDFKRELQALFADARSFIEGLNLDAVVGSLADRIAEFTQALQQAQLKPYFDTAVGAIGSAADVVAAVPFDLLPESMKADVDAAVAPIKAVDLVAFESQIEGLVGIGADGKFTPRADLDTAIADIQHKFDALITTLHEHDPALYLQQLDDEIGALAESIRAIAPAVTLQPVQDAVDQVKAAVAGFDLAAQLQPLQQVFEDAVAAMQAYSPAQLIVPLEERVAAARTQLLGLLPLQSWSDTLGGLRDQATRALDIIDPARLEGQLTDLLTQARDLAAALPNGPDTGSLPWLGTLMAALHRGSGVRIDSHSFVQVQRWIASGAGADALTARSAAIADAVAHTRDAVAGIDVVAITAALATRAQPLRSALANLLSALPADSPRRPALAALELQLDVQADWGALGANRERYLALLTAALPLGETLRRTGLSEVNGVIAQLHTTFEPLITLLNTAKAFVRAAGLAQVDQGVVPMLAALFDAAPPARLARLTAPVFSALRGRVQAVIDAVVQPLQDALARLVTLIQALDLAPLRQAVDAVFQAAVDEVRALSPAQLLAEPLAAVAALKAQVAAFDPLHALLSVLDTLRDTVARVLAKLDTQALLADPLVIYREIVDALDALNVQALMGPVLDLLDSIAHDVDQGLDDTVSAFQRLQDALPAGGGGSSASVAVG